MEEELRQKGSNPQTPIQNPFDPGYFSSEELLGFGFASVGRHVRIAKNATIIGLANINIGNNVRIDGNVVVSANAGFLRLGNFIHVGGSCFLSCAGGITLSDFSGLSQGVRIYSSSDDYSGRHLTNPTVAPKYLCTRIAPVTLGKHVIVGSGSVILPGVTIGEGTAIGALSLVTKSLNSWEIFCGVPVKRLTSRSRELLTLEAQLLREQCSLG